MRTKFTTLLYCFFIGIIIIPATSAQEKKSVKSPEKPKVYTIDNCFNKFSIDKAIKTEVGYQYWFADVNFIDGRTLKMSAVRPGSATHAPHKHADDEFFFVIEGTAEFFLDGKTKVSGPYASFYCPSNVMHGIRNIGDVELKYLVIRKYEQEK